MKELTITISGPAASGKSTMALLLEDFLNEQGFNAEIDLEPEIEDYGTEMQFRGVCSLDWQKKLTHLKNVSKITIKQMRTVSGPIKDESRTDKND